MKTPAARFTLLIMSVMVLLIWQMVTQAPAAAPAPCDRDCYVNRKAAEREATARDQILADLNR